MPPLKAKKKPGAFKKGAKGKSFSKKRKNTQNKQRYSKVKGGGGKFAKDKRFAAAVEDGRFRSVPKRKNQATKDSRFDIMHSNPAFRSQYKVDRFGRKIEDMNEDDNDEEDRTNHKQRSSVMSDIQRSQKSIHGQKFLRYKKRLAQKAAELMGGSDEKNDDSDALAFFDRYDKSKQKKRSKKERSDVDDSDEDSGDDDDGYDGDSGTDEEDRAMDEAEERNQGEMFDYDPSDTDSSEGAHSDGNYEELAPYDIGEDMRALLDTSQVPDVSPTRRLAMVNLDWDLIRAVDIFMVLRSFVDSGGLKSVAIHPSEFGSEQLKKEELMGPDRRCWKAEGSEDDDDLDSNNEPSNLKSASSVRTKTEEEISEAMKAELMRLDEIQQNLKRLKEAREGDVLQDAEQSVVDKSALRKYELQRLRYYYAVIECDSSKTADQLYQACDGREFEQTGNLMDLRFIEDDFVPPFESTDYCDQIPDKYTPSSGVQSSCLSSTFVSLSWDKTDPNRLQMAKRSFKEDEILKMDLQAYLQSDGEITDAGFETDLPVTEYETDTEDKKVKVKRRARQRYKGILDDLNATMKALAPDSSSSDSDSSEDGSDDGSKKDPNMVIEDHKLNEMDTTKDEMNEMESDQSSEESGEEVCVISDLSAEEREMEDNTLFPDADSDDEDLLQDGDDMPSELMDDPYFKEELMKQMMDPSSLSNNNNNNEGESHQSEIADSAQNDGSPAMKKRRLSSNKSSDLSAEDKRRAELEMLMMGDEYDPEDCDLDMGELSAKFEKRIQKDWRLKRAIKKQIAKKTAEMDEFKFDHSDSRFTAMYDDPSYAIDPTNPDFKSTMVMDSVMHQARSNRKLPEHNGGSSSKISRKRKQVPKDELDSIAEKLRKNVSRFTEDSD